MRGLVTSVERTVATRAACSSRDSAGHFEAIQISWVGIYKPIVRGHVVAITKLKISKEEARALARAAHSGYEQAVIDWVPLRKPIVRAFIQAPRSTYPNKVGSTLYVNHRKSAYIANWATTTVIPIWLSAFTPGTPIKVGNNPQVIIIAPNGKTAYVVNNADGTVTPITLRRG